MAAGWKREGVRRTQVPFGCLASFRRVVLAVVVVVQLLVCGGVGVGGQAHTVGWSDGEGSAKAIKVLAWRSRAKDS